MKKYKVYITKFALKDLEGIYNYISESDSGMNAEKLIKLIINKYYTLEFFPERCKIVPELFELGIYAYRQLIVKEYKIIYDIEEKNVHIDSILDARRNLKDILLERISNL